MEKGKVGIIYNRYFMIDSGDGFNFPLNHTTHNKLDYVEMNDGDVFKFTEEGVWFIGLNNGKDKFYLHKWVGLKDWQVYYNSEHGKESKECFFKDVTKKFNRNKNIKNLLDN